MRKQSFVSSKTSFLHFLPETVHKGCFVQIFIFTRNAETFQCFRKTEILYLIILTALKFSGEVNQLAPPKNKAS